MKQSEALQIINNLIIATQKARSIMDEMINPDDDPVADWVLDEMFPYSHGDDSILPTLLKMSDSKILAPLDLYNILTLIDMKGSDVEAAYVSMGFGVLPERQISWMTDGWESEEN